MYVKVEFAYGAAGSLDVFVSVSTFLAGDGCRQSFAQEILAAWMVLTVTTSLHPPKILGYSAPKKVLVFR